MPHMIGVVGRLGAGKTTIATVIAHLYKSKIESKGGHLKLFANCDIDGAERMKEAEDWFKVAEAHGSLCLWDESHRSFNSRKSISFHNILANDVLTFCRKMAAIQIFVTPSIKRLDVVIRDMLEVLIVVRPMGNKGIKFDYFDFTAEAHGPYGEFLHSRFLSAGKVKQIHALNLFDSHSFVSGFPLPKTEREANTFMAELEARHDEARKAKRGIEPL